MIGGSQGRMEGAVGDSDWRFAEERWMKMTLFLVSSFSKLPHDSHWCEAQFSGYVTSTAVLLVL